ncbi:MAG: TraM recognition domain-containing protein [Gammaproteobacteria bacterium]
MAVLRGLEKRHEQDPSLLIRDTRTGWQRFTDFLKNPLAVVFTLVLLASVGFFIPAITDVTVIIGLWIFLYTYTRKTTLPFRLPMRSKALDYNDPKPGSNKPQQARGIYFFGNELKTDLELWFANEDMRTHALIFGSTGSGKTEALISIAYNALLQSSGFIYVDGKGDNSLFAKIFSMVRSMGREDDMLLINFMTGARDIIGPQKKRLSNTMNPFASGSSSMLSQLVVSLMDSSAGSSDGDMWKGRAIAFVEALMKLLVAMRDSGHILLDANTIRNYFLLERLESIVIDKVFPRDGQEAISLDFLPPLVMEPITNYLANLPGYNKEKKGKQVSQVLEQHGFITMQLTRAFGSLADTYGHIVRTNLAEVDLKDVVLNRRILVVLLPALEKAPAELANLGKVIIASLKAMMAAGLGDEVEGDYRDVVQRKPTNAPTPYLCILDEYGYYAVEGFAVVPAQARSLGFSVIFAGQDLPAFQKASKEEAASIGANTNIKICMKLEDPLETWDFFMKTAGESYVTHVESFQADAKTVMNNYADSKSARVEKRARVDLLDLKEQREGEMHIFFKSKLIRAKVFFANPKPVKKMRLSHFLKVGLPLDSELYKLAKGFEQMQRLANQSDALFADAPAASNDIVLIAQTFDDPERRTTSAIDNAVNALLAVVNREATPLEEVQRAELPSEQLNIFEPIRLTEELQVLLSGRNLESFSSALLDHQHTLKQSQYIGRLLGKAEQDATRIAIEIMKDIETATFYPPEVSDIPTGEELGAAIDELIAQVVLRKQESQKSDESKV